MGMAASKDERDRILQLVEAGQLSAAQAAELFDAWESEVVVPQERPVERRQNRTLRWRATNLKSRSQKMHLTGSMPVPLVKVSLRLGAQLIPQLKNNIVEDLVHAIDSGTTGRLLDLQDLENGERLEIFVE
jgi:hypothetical protein